ncbi:MAG: aldolase/citrate lyase family protein [Alphaproteobacteria bacterium]|nr:aldolase/citrate lyase family protein [Alphaproteobacteria bacterium]
MPVTLPPNSLKRALAKNQPQFGFWLTTGSPTATEIVASSGFDWLLIDMEHSVNELPDVVDHLRAATGGTGEPVVRIPWNESVTVKRMLDAGVRSIMFPYVQTPEEARAAVAATRYPPEGVRGFAGGARATRYGRIPDYFKRYAEDIAVIVQIESPAAVEAAAAIAAVDGVDCVFIGPNDLASNMGFLANSAAPEVRRMLQRGLENIRKGRKAAGVLEYREDEAQKLMKDGFAMIAVGGDAGMLARGADRLAKVFKPGP